MMSEYDWILKNNPSNTNPYHNLYHAECVAKNAYQLCEYYNVRNIKQVVTAALFHDFGHTGRPNKDSVNIENAINGYRQYCIEQGNREESIVIELIAATEFPHQTIITPNILECQILRDADMAQFIYDNWVQQIIFGLFQQELGFTLQEAITKEIEFLQSLEFYTDRAKEIYTPYIQMRLESLQKMSPIL